MSARAEVGRRYALDPLDIFTDLVLTLQQYARITDRQQCYATDIAMRCLFVRTNKMIGFTNRSLISARMISRPADKDGAPDTPSNRSPPFEI